jgi:DNA repair protein RAD5
VLDLPLACEKDKPKSNNDPNESSGEDDSEELEEDQLDTLYQKH